MKITPPALHSDTEMLVVFNDTQLKRNCDEEALGAGIAFLEHYKDKITHFVFNGDIMDFEEQSLFAKFPDQHGQSSIEIRAGKWLIKYISELLPNATKIFVMGNHDQRWENMIKNQTMGIEEWIIPFDDMFGLSNQGWQLIDYGRGKFYRWHDRIFWHGARSGQKSNVPKLEYEDNFVSVTTAHINRNMYWETVDTFKNHKSAIAHGGFSKDNLGFVKKSNTTWSQGFGVYYWDEVVGEQVYSVVLKHGSPIFIYNGLKFDGRGWRIP